MNFELRNDHIRFDVRDRVDNTAVSTLFARGFRLGVPSADKVVESQVFVVPGLFWSSLTY